MGVCNLGVVLKSSGFNSNDVNFLNAIDNIRIKKVQVNNKQKEWRIFTVSDISMNHDMIDTVKSFLCSKYAINNVYIIVEKNKNTTKTNKQKLLMDFITQTMPSLRGWLSFCKIDFDNNIDISISNNVAFDYFKENNVVQKIQEWSVDTLGHSVEVNIDKVDIDETIELQYSKKRKEELKEITKKAVIHINNKNSNEDEKKPIKSQIILGKSISTKDIIAIKDLRDDSGVVVIEGNAFDVECRQTKSGKYIYCYDITDNTSSISCKIFCDESKAKILNSSIKIGSWYRIRGECQYDKYQKEIVVMIRDIISISPKERLDVLEKKRVELHAHTKMSAMDSVVSTKKLVETAAKWGHKAIAITDHGVVQSFPDAYDAGKKHGIKIIYGVEAYIVNDSRPAIIKNTNQALNDTFVVFDLETTGLDKKQNEIIEIGAVKISNKKIIDTFSCFVKPSVTIPSKITKLTGISDEMVKDAEKIETVLPKFYKFVGESILVAHNANFDYGFLENKGDSVGLKFKNSIIDTLQISRCLLKDLKSHKLNLVAKHLGVSLERHHRAIDDAQTTAEIFLTFVEMLDKRGCNTLEDINEKLNAPNVKNKSYHAVILVKNYKGLMNLYKLVSEAHLNYFYRRPRIPKSLLNHYREGLIIGSACDAGELYKAVLNNKSDWNINRTARFYDYIEIQPLGNCMHLLKKNEVSSKEELININKKLYSIGKKLGKPIVATCDVHFLNPADEYYRRILMKGQGFDDANEQAPLYFRTTEEMLAEFEYLGKEKAREVVINSPSIIADTIEEIMPIPDRLYQPEIEGAEEDIRLMSLDKACSIYGNDLPHIVSKRLDKELDSIINNGFAVLYLIAHKLVKKSLSDNYLVGSRGSVGSSFVATMTDITEVNPLPPHYVCPKCKHSDFDIDKKKFACGADLPDKKCSICNADYNKDGYDIPFEVFLGFKGDKVPDIDLNFSGDYQPVAHKFTEELFGVGHVFRAGTIGTIADKTAFGFVKKYFESENIVATNAEIKRLVKGCTGVKRTTGQHPGGVMVVPRKNNIYQFSPIQRPANDKKSDIITTHFDYHSISSRLVKLDILGHDDPTVIRMLEDLTGIDARSISIDNEETMKIFSSTDSLGVTKDDIGSEVGTFGIPEFGTKFVRQMLIDTRPKTFSELIRISGLSHGTDVWLNNAQDLIREGIAKLSQVICTRDDIMLYLIDKGVDPTISFKIMESVRKGKGLTPEFEKSMIDNNVEDWFIGSCKKIKYMFPKAHAAAYVLMAFRIAYFKVHYPKAFYATYFTVRADDFDADYVLCNAEELRLRIKDIQSKGREATNKEKGLLTIMELVLEMYCRGISLLPVELYKSDANRFIITEQGIRLPYNSLPGVGDTVAKKIVEQSSETKFTSIEDFRNRTRASKTVIELLKLHGVFGSLPETSQLCLF